MERLRLITGNAAAAVNTISVLLQVSEAMIGQEGQRRGIVLMETTDKMKEEELHAQSKD